jgi:stage II sporulation protein D
VRRLAPLSALLLLLAVAPVQAATRHVVRGAGWGHGIGMSQYGAKGFAEHGASYREILRHYFQGTDIGRADDRTIRVLLQSGRDEIGFSNATRAPGMRLDPDRTYRARANGFSQVDLLSARGTLLETFDAPLRIANPGDVVSLRGTAINGVRNGLYRGALEIRPGVFGGLGAVNALDIDDYVKGVVPGEMPASWHPEALKAQAVAARSYAIATNRGGGVFDQYPDTRSQVYRGFGSEQPSSNAAVDATSHEIVTYGGRPIATFFFSTSGGKTENIENVFYGSQPEPYYTSVDDPYDDASPRHRWRFTFTQSQMQSKLRGIVKGRLRRIKVVKRGVSPRIVWADVVGSRGKTRVRGATLRTKLGLYDTWATFTRVSTRSRSSSARSASFFVRILGLPSKRELVGTFEPRPRGGRLVVERRTRRGWKRVRRARTTRAGRYHVRVRGAGVYRVRAGGVSGPAVRVR